MNINQAWQWCQQNAQKVLYKYAVALRGTGKVLSPLKNKEAALPIIWAHPFYFIYDWIKEVLKTTFDLYSSQLVKFADKTFHWDPIEEFLAEKVVLALWAQPMPLVDAHHCMARSLLFYLVMDWIICRLVFIFIKTIICR